MHRERAAHPPQPPDTPGKLVKGRDEEEPAAALRRCLLREAGRGEPRVEVGRPGACGTPDGIQKRHDRVVVAEDDEVAEEPGVGVGVAVEVADAVDDRTVRWQEFSGFEEPADTAIVVPGTTASGTLGMRVEDPGVPVSCCS